MRTGFTDLTSQAGACTCAGRYKSNIHPRWAALRFKLIQTRRRRFLSRCSRCRSLRAHAKGRWGRVHRDDDLFEVLDEVHGCPYVVQYVVQYVTEWSFATQLNQELQAGDVYACGYGNPDLKNSPDDTPGPDADGWFVYQNSSHDSKEATLAEYRSGSEVDATTLQFRKLFQTFGRLAGETNWYNVGNTRLVETTTGDYDGKESIQRNERVGRVSVDDGKGPELPLIYISEPTRPY